MVDPTQAGFEEVIGRAGTRVRKRFNPSMIGICTGKVDGVPGDLEVQVSFNGQHPEWTLAADLELMDSASTDPIDLMMKGQAGRSRDLRRELARVQLSGRLSDVFYSMDTTNTEFMPHQFKPVLAMLDSPSQGLLIADEVGLGKTIEAGLIWTELRFRKQARRLLVICPAMLTDKWQMELRNRFGTHGLIVSASELLTALEQSEPAHQDTQCFICSLQGLRPPGDWDDETKPNQRAAAKLARKFQEAAGADTLFDLTIIDEAHYLRNIETASAKLGELLRPVSSHLVLLTATPINTKNADLHAMLKLVDPDQFRFEHEFSAVLHANRPLVRATALLRQAKATIGEVRSALEEARLSPVLANMEQLRLLLDETSGLDPTKVLTPNERISLSQRVENINLLGHAITRTRKREVFENSVVRDPKRTAVRLAPTEQMFYDRVTAAVRDFAEKHQGVEGFLLATPQRQMVSCMPAAAKRWLRAAAVEPDAEFNYEAFGVDESADVSPLVAHIVRFIGDVDVAALRSEDSKLKELRRTLTTYFEDFPDEKVIVFSYFRDTLAYLKERLAEVGITSVIVQGGDRKVEIIEDFKQSPSVRVLLSSEVASEGVDLQFMRLLINYDLPWNPMKVEQRIGRIDRIGQKADRISIINFVYEETIDDRILRKLFHRLDLFKNALGGAEDVLGEEMAELTRELLSGRLTPAQEEARIEQTAAAIEQRRTDLQKIEEHEGDLLGLGDFVRKRIDDARNSGRRVSDKDLFTYIQEFLNLHAQGHTLQQDVSQPLRYRMKLPPTVAVGLERFIDAKRLRRSKLTAGQETLVWIENHVSGKRDSREELINQFHPLIGFISEQYGREAPSPPAVAVEATTEETGGRLTPGAYAFVSELWSFAGSRNEELIRAGFVRLTDGALIDGQEAADVLSALRTGGRDWVTYMQAVEASGAPLEAIERAQRSLLRAFKDEARRRKAENDDRVRLQGDSIRRNFSRRDRTLAERLAASEIGDKRVVKANRVRISKQREALKTTTDLLLAKLDMSASFAQEQARCCTGLLRIV